MKVKNSGARFSAIVGIGEKIKKLSDESGYEYLYLNRGVNAVCNINLEEVVKQIDFNSNTIQVYPPNSGFPKLRHAINESYFHNQTKDDNITVVAGGMGGLDLVFQTLDINKIVLPKFYWGAYTNIGTIRNLDSSTYDNLDQLRSLKDEMENAAVIICDPNNPIGNKYDDGEVMDTIKVLNHQGIVVIFDSPYRRIFYDRDDTMFKELTELENVITVESFSKSVGLSGQRLAFVHSLNSDFNTEIAIRVLYANNGINGFAQELVYQLLSTPDGHKAVNDFRNRTKTDIALNIKYLEEQEILAREFYKDSSPMGIFVVVNRTEEELLKQRIGSVSLSFFTKDHKAYASAYSRICASVPHQKFKDYFGVFSGQPLLAGQ
jgi:aspartate/methionine/tyrosine aminotransferase